MSHDARLREEIRTYYDTVSRYIERELIGRHDRTFWEGRARRMLRRKGPLEGGPAILELGCGTGRITEILATVAAPVVGIDLSAEMLRRARRRLGGCPNVHLVQADMRTLRLSRRFRLVVAANDPFTHLVDDEDRDRALKAVVRHLEPGSGRFVLDAFWLGRERLERAGRPGGYRRERTAEHPGGAGVKEGSRPSSLKIREAWQCDPSTRRCRVTYEYIEDGDPIDRASFHARLWSRDEVEERFGRAGLRIRSICGGFDGRDFDADHARHLVVEGEINQ